MGLAQSFLNRCQQFEYIERLAHIGEAPALEFRAFIVRGNEEDRHMPRARIPPHGIIHRETIRAGELIIEDQEINRLFGKKADGIAPIMQNERSRIRFFPQCVRDEGRNAFIILNN